MLLVICQPSRSFLEFSVAELGAGTGLVGITAATLGANVVISDLPIYVDAIQENIEHNRDIIQGDASARSIDWTEPVAEDLVGSADIVIVCDCVYYEASLQPLVSTIRDLLKNADKSCVIFAYEERPDKILLYQQFFELVHKHFVVTEIFNKRLESGNQMFLYRLNKS